MTAIRKLISHSFVLLTIALVLGAARLPSQSNPQVQSQESPPAVAQAPALPPVTVSYPDNERGLKQLVTDVLKAQEKGDSVRARQLLDSLVLPNFHGWYAENFSDPAVAKVTPAYEAALPRLAPQLAQIFLSARQEGFRGVEAVRYPDEKSARSSPPVFSAMTFRRTQVPLYELRFTQGNSFKRVYAFAYVDGAFRIVLVPDFSKPMTPPPSRVDDSKANAVEPRERVQVGATVQAARLVCRVTPYYPEDARRAYISGTVRLHVIIGRDGGAKQLEVVSGPDALVPASKAAVSQWRYRPVLLNGEPVEVDTTIDVIYSLNY